MTTSFNINLFNYKRHRCGEGVLDKDHCEEEFDIQEIQVKSREHIGNHQTPEVVEQDDADHSDSSKAFLDGTKLANHDAGGSATGNEQVVP